MGAIGPIASQLSFALPEYSQNTKVTHRENVLREMEQALPWVGFMALIEPHYHNGQWGPPAMGTERMLGIYFSHHWHRLADEALEDNVCDSQAMRNVAGIDLGRKSVPDATTLWEFRHLPGRQELTGQLLEAINALLAEKHFLKLWRNGVRCYHPQFPWSHQEQGQATVPGNEPDQEG